MLPNDRAQPAADDKVSWGARLLRAQRRAPTWLKITAAAVAVLFFPVTLGLIILAALVYAVVSVVQGRRTAGASASVAVWGLVAFTAFSNGNRSWLFSLPRPLPFVVALAAHARPLARWFIPCRTVAWVLAWSVPAGIIALKAAPDQPFLGTIAAWLLAAAVLGSAGGQGHPGHPHVRRPQPGSPAEQSAGNASPAAQGGQPPATQAALRRACGRRPRRCRTPSTPRVTTKAAPPGRGRRSRSRTRWPNSTR